jgi:uncharacterized protein YjiS (DUF1127 family)
MTSTHRAPDGFARRLSAPASVAAAATLPYVGSRPRGTSTVWHALVRALRAARDWRGRARQRRALMELSDHLLRDIGISRADALCEATRPFWRR